MTGCLLFACSKKSPLLYSENSRIYFALQKAAFYKKYNTQNESGPKRVVINFLGRKSSVVTDTLKMNLRITGIPASYEKTFNLTVSGKDLEEGRDYSLPDKGMKFPVGVTDATYRLVVMRTPKIRETPTSLRVSLSASDDFELGPQADTSFVGDASIISITDLTFVTTDIALKPKNWDTKLKTYFGEYSEVRYRFVIDVLGIVTFADSLAAGTLSSYRTSLRNASTAYNAANPANPLRDENGVLITF